MALILRLALLNSILFAILIIPNCFSALVDGTTCGFVTSAPTGNPGGTDGVNLNARTVANRYTSPSGTNSISEIGWYTIYASEEANFEVGIYSHDSGNNKPNLLLASNPTNAKGTTAGWKTSSISYNISASTIYWIATQCDGTVTNSRLQYTTDAGYKRDYQDSTTTLSSPWGTSTGTVAQMISIYALYSSSGATSYYNLFTSND